MIRNRLYYRIKPLLPWPVRMGVRRFFALRRRPRVEHSWPIMPGSERPPDSWPGWPNGKKFALVLTHDVEGKAGFDKVHKVIQLEQSLGFRSSFNLIPEGDEYTVTPEFRRAITDRGFEVGVHDLHHDGKLFLTENEFRRKAPRINHYLKDWGAAGFRAGFMLHHRDWLHSLDLQYDASTFDTDPFEPQPEGSHTIFPFWVPRSPRPSDGRGIKGEGSDPLAFSLQPLAFPGYVELPYTLPQDSTLFLLLRERHPDIWMQKLDWIAKHGGMALVNVHPDYARFDAEPNSARTYPADLYRRFLEYARERYADSFWQPLPRELAGFVSSHRPPPRRPPRRICMLTHSFYTSDARVTRYAEALAERGDHVEVFALRRSPEVPLRENVAGVHLVRLQPRFGKTEKSRLSYLLPVLRFLFSASVRITRRHARQPYDLLHIHNVPDFLVFAAWYPRLTGAKIILDIHDIVPEFYASKFNAPDSSFLVRSLKWAERASARFAHHVIIANHLWLDKYAARTRSEGKCSVFINNVDSRIFHPRPRTRNDGKLLVLFPGGLQWHQGLDIALRAFPKVRRQFANAEFHIYGDGNMKESLVALARELGLNGSVRFFNPLPVRQVAEIMANADLGIVPKRADSFGNEAYSTKIMEFMSLGVPVVVSSTKIDRYYFNDSLVRFFESGNADALAAAMIEALRNESRRAEMVRNASAYALRQSWESRKGEYLALVDRLVAGHPVPKNPLDPGPTSAPKAASAPPAPEPRELASK